MRLFLAILCGVVLVTACKREVVEQPEDLIPPRQMVDVLYDLAVLNAAQNTNPGVLESRGVEIMEYLYSKYDIDSAQFARSDTYYASKPLQYQAIYEIIDRRLEQEKEQMELERKRQTDSVRKAQQQQSVPDSLN